MWILFLISCQGDEVTGQYMILNLIEYLLGNYTKDTRVQKLVNETHIFLIPLANPDGFYRCTRENANGKDLNRDFPDRLMDPVDSTERRQPETAVMMDFIKVISTHYFYCCSGLNF